MPNIDETTYRGVLGTLAMQTFPGKPSVKPSSFACFRRVVFDLLGTEQRSSITPQSRMLMDTGTALHRMIQEHFKKAIPIMYPGATVQDELKVNGDTCARAAPLLIRSSFDLVIRFPNDRPRVVEIKSVGKSEMDTLGNTPRSKDVVQLNTYLYLIDARQGYFMYIDRGNTYRTKFMPWPFDPVMWSETESRIQMAIQASFEHRLPPAPKDDYACGICPYVWCCPPKEGWHDA